MKALAFVWLSFLTVVAFAQETSPDPEGRQRQLKGLDQTIQNTDEYQKYPRRLMVGAKATEEVTRYLTPVLSKIEKVGTLSYPEEARGKIYGTVLVEVEIKAPGTLGNVTVVRSSGHKMLDSAALRAVQASAPFDAFPEELAKRFDILVVIRAFKFTNPP